MADKLLEKSVSNWGHFKWFCCQHNLSKCQITTYSLAASPIDLNSLSIMERKTLLCLKIPHEIELFPKSVKRTRTEIFILTSGQDGPRLRFLFLLQAGLDPERFLSLFPGWAKTAAMQARPEDFGPCRSLIRTSLFPPKIVF